jgi:hypothetical protein
LERDLDDPLERLLPERLPPLFRDEPDRLALERLLPLPDRDELERERDELEPERDLVDRLLPPLDLVPPDRDELDRLVPDRLLPPLDLLPPERDDELERERDELALERERDELEPPELLDDRRRVRDDPLRRSAAGISSRATAFASWGICFWRKLAMRSSSRRIDLASFAVSLSPTLSASASMAVYWPISWNSSVSSVRAFFHIFSDSPVPRSACSGP